MTSRTLKTTTAVLAAMSLLQPLPAMTQSISGAVNSATGARLGWDTPMGDSTLRAFEQECADANILEAAACELFILTQDSEAGAEATTSSEAEAEAEAEDAETEAESETAAEAEEEAQQAAEPAEAEAEAEAEANAAAEAEAAARAEQAEQEAEAQAEDAAAAAAAAEADAAEAQAEAEAEAEARADAAAEAAEDAELEAEAAADAQAEADAQEAADAQTEAEAARAAEAEAEAEAATDTATTQQAETTVEDCTAEIVGQDGTLQCADGLGSEEIDAVAAEGEGATDAEVSTETLTDDTQRSSSEEFREWNPDSEADSAATEGADQTEQTAAQADSGLSDLEKAGLFVLGAVAVGAILSNGQRVESNTGDRVVVVDDEGTYRVLKDDDALLRQPGSEVRTERFSDGSTRTTVTRDDGTRITTIRDSGGRALRRTRIDPDGREYLLIDDTRTYEPVVVRDLPRPVYDEFDYQAASDRESLRQALLAVDRRDLGRSFSLRQVRETVEVRELAPEINLGAITFATDSAALSSSQAEQLRQMGLLMRDLIAENPTELLLIEGHTDAVGDAGYNLLLSDRRAETVALALNEYYQVPTENMVVQGYGERFLRIQTQEAERLNRRVAVRRITPLLQRD